MKRPICLDLHGVCSDFIGSFLSWHEISMEWPKGVSDIELVTGKDIKDLPLAFYENLRTMPDFPDLFGMVRERTVIASYTIMSRPHAFGTYFWFLKNFESIMLMPAFKYKGAYFTDEAILIDDNEDEIANWSGPSILVPRQWNSRTGDAVEVVRSGLAAIDRQERTTIFNSFVPEGSPKGI